MFRQYCGHRLVRTDRHVDYGRKMHRRPLTRLNEPLEKLQIAFVLETMWKVPSVGSLSKINRAAVVAA